MPAWVRTQGGLKGFPEIFTRPLGLLEEAYYWDSICSGATDILVQLTLVASPQFFELFSKNNVSRAWLALKARHPLLGARLCEWPDAGGVDFVVESDRLNVLGPEELVFVTCESDKEACALANEIMNGRRRLSNELLAQLWIVSFTPLDAGSSSLVNHQVFLHVAHCIQDGMAQSTILREFLDVLVHAYTPRKYVPDATLEHLLALHLPVDDLHPVGKYSLARRRWRLAIAHIIYLNRMTAMKGGHTLPYSIAARAPRTPPVSRTLRLKIPKEESERILKSCREAKITLGQALPVLCQLAHSRTLHRLYSQGKFSKEEWTFRIRQPMHFIGPFNLRPYLDQEWLGMEGADRVCSAISFYPNTLPSMPISGLPISRGWSKLPFETLMSRNRFFHRCHIAKRQTNDFLCHPLITEFAQVSSLLRVRKARLDALNWRAQHVTTEDSKRIDTLVTGNMIHEMPLDGCVYSNRCSTMGDMSKIIPANYPLDPVQTSDAQPRLRVTSIRHYIGDSPAELYLSSMSYHQELHLVLFCDMSTYDEALVEDWLSNLYQAAEWYLGGNRPTTTEGKAIMANL